MQDICYATPVKGSFDSQRCRDRLRTSVLEPPSRYWRLCGRKWLRDTLAAR